MPCTPHGVQGLPFVVLVDTKYRAAQYRQMTFDVNTFPPSGTCPASGHGKALHDLNGSTQGLKLRTLLSTLNLSYPYHISTECTCQGDRDRVQADGAHGKKIPTGWLSCLRMSSGRGKALA